ncbi:phosphoserine phosphatase [Populus alba x Populus x berolinensis]|nr:phosphoserine phosphatase [Populus alba x Populus x berolinensis]
MTVILQIWRSADAVCFDVDSTVCLDEGIDELAEFCGAGKAVADWTARISPGINELVKKLKAKNTNVYLISGGFRQMINVCYCITGFCLCINAFFFFACCINPWYSTRKHICKPATLWKFWEFVGFDVNEPTSRSGGKATAVQKIRKVHGYKALVMIGDGATDLEARKPGGADLFICYGGVQLREAVAVKADWLVFNFADLINSLE